MEMEEVGLPSWSPGTSGLLSGGRPIRIPQEELERETQTELDRELKCCSLHEMPNCPYLTCSTYPPELDERDEQEGNTKM